MLNLIGAVPAPADVLAISAAHLHVYGKTPRAGRKLGHVTLLADDWPELLQRLAALQRIVDS
jgi:5-(carboxyamino)imidazole ribonucleotide synthase